MNSIHVYVLALTCFFILTYVVSLYNFYIIKANILKNKVNSSNSLLQQSNNKKDSYINILMCWKTYTISKLKFPSLESLCGYGRVLC